MMDNVIISFQTQDGFQNPSPSMVASICEINDTKAPHEPHNKTTSHQPWVSIAYIPIGQSKVLDCE